MASTNLRRTQSTPTDNNLYTFSCWVKRGNLGGVQALLGSFTNSTNRGQLEFNSSNQLNYYENLSGSTSAQVTTTQVFRDTSAWYHIVLNVDLDQTTASDRIKMYVNGTQITSFGTTTYPSQGATSVIANCTASNGLLVGGSTSDNSTFYNIDGSMAHVHFIDGTAYDADTFGETDATTGIWKPKTAPSVTYGTNGFFLKFASAGSLGTDSSGNGNNFTLNGSGTQTQDTPSNVFATMNPLIYDNFSDITYGNGNTTFTATGSNFQSAYSTLAASSGKYYFELKHNSTTNFGFIGIREASTVTQNGGYLGQSGQTLAWGYYSDSGVIFNNGSTTAYGDSWNGTGDIVSCALDLDNNKLYFAKNGVWQNSGDPTSGATGTGAVSISAGTYYLAGTKPNSASATLFMNFGNGYFGTTAVSSAQSPSDGIGLFEYAVPSGYKALCTKSINSQEYS